MSLTKIGKYLNVIGYIVLIGLIVYMWESKNEVQKISDDNLLASQATIKTYKDKFDRTVSEKRAITLENAKLLRRQDSLKSLIKPYSKPEVIIKWKTKLVYKDSIKIVYKDPIPFEFERKFEYKQDWIQFSGLSTNKGLSINTNTLAIPNDQSLVIGYKRNNIFQAKYANVSIANTNPYLQTTSMQSYVIKPKKGFFQRWYVHVGIGIGLGLLIK